MACSAPTKQTCSAGSADYYTSTTATVVLRVSACWPGWAGRSPATAADGILTRASSLGLAHEGSRGAEHRRAGVPATAATQETMMTYVVTESCIKCKYMDCVEVCPVDCFYEGENML